METFLTPAEVDDRLGLPRGRARRMALRSQLPATILPDGTILFAEEVLQRFLLERTITPWIVEGNRSPQGVDR